MLPTTRAVQEGGNGNLTLNSKTATGLAHLALSSVRQATGCPALSLLPSKAAAAQAPAVVVLEVVEEACGKDSAQLVLVAVVALRASRLVKNLALLIFC